MKKTFKSFGATFIVMFVIFIVALVPANYALEKVGGIRIFGGTENLKKDMEISHNVSRNSPFYEQFMDTSRVNVLLMGINGHMTDTMMLGSYDMKNQRVDIISIPRDTYFPKGNATSPAAKKINAIYGREGATGTAEAVSELLMGMPIDYYAVISYDGVSSIVDAIGGVPVDIPINMNYDDVYDDPPLHIHFNKGPITLDGPNAVKFLRYRKNNASIGGGYPEGDVGRVKAQQEFVKAAFKQAISYKLPKVAVSIMKNVDSDLDLAMAGKIAKNAVGLEASDLRTWTIGGESETRNNASYWIADDSEIEKMITEIYAEPTPEPEK